VLVAHMGECGELRGELGGVRTGPGCALGACAWVGGGSRRQVEHFEQASGHAWRARCPGARLVVFFAYKFCLLALIFKIHMYICLYTAHLKFITSNIVVTIFSSCVHFIHKLLTPVSLPFKAIQIQT
jgi:hypothetical protein